MKVKFESKTARDTILFTISSVFYQGSRFLTYLVAAKILGPTTYGLWNGLLLILTYGMNSHFGVLNAMNREIPFYQGKGEFNKVQEITNIGFSTALFSSILLAVAIFLITFIGSWSEDTTFAIRIVALLLVLQQIHNFYQLILKSHSFFGLMASQQAFSSMLTLTIVIGFTYYGGFTGFLWGQVFVFMAVLLFLHKYTSVNFGFQFSWGKAIKLARIGFPIMAVGLAYGMLVSMDRIMVLSFLGIEQLGYYSLSFMAYSIMMLFPMVVAQVIYPNMVKEYGRTFNKKALEVLIYRPLKYLLIVMIPILTITYLIAPIFIRQFLPEYVPGIPALKVTLLGVFPLCFIGGFANFLNTVNKQKLYLIVQIFALGLNFVLNYLFIKMGYGITGVAIGTAITYAVYVITLWFFTSRVIKYSTL
ncbi:MAG: oligosaccharide flippase family protein [Candidatus Anammoxibacter sp.]